eukprot:g5070.t1
MGAFLSVLFFTLVGFLFFASFEKLWRTVRCRIPPAQWFAQYECVSRIVNLEHEVVFNTEVIPDRQNIFYLDVPPISLDIEAELDFFEADGAAAIQRIDVVDGTGYSPHPLRSGKSQDDNDKLVRAVVRTFEVPLNTFQNETQPFPPDGKEFSANGVRSSLEDEYQKGSNKRFSETLRALYFAYAERASNSYFNLIHIQKDYNATMHSAAVAATRSPGVDGACSSSSSSSTTTADNATSMVSTTSNQSDTSSNSSSNFSAVSAASSFAVEGVEDSLWGDWVFQISYVNNFNYTFQLLSCDGSSSFNLDYAKAVPPSANTTMLLIPKSITTGTSGAESTTNQSSLYDRLAPPYPTPPFQIVVSGTMGERERMVVLAVDRHSDPSNVILHVNRTDELAYDFQNTTETDASTTKVYPPSPPDSWTCAPLNYNQWDGCDCECGAYDPDCLHPQQEMKRCSDVETCSSEGKCTSAITSGSGKSDTGSSYRIALNERSGIEEVATVRRVR